MSKVKSSLELSPQDQYSQEHDRLIVLIERFKACKTMHGRKWREGMVNHYERQLNDLDNEYRDYLRGR